MPALRLTVLGSGTSMGVPTIGCDCLVCRSSDPRDNRTRPSLLLSYNGRNVVVDTTPDFRAQALRVGLKRLDAVLLTHAHADHILGLDDIRPFNLLQKAVLPVYGSPETLETVQRTFAYIFDSTPTHSTLPGVRLHPIRGPFDLFGLRVIPIPAMHGPMPVLGFRFGPAAYLTDFSTVPRESLRLLRGLDLFILDALRFAPHPMHSNVEQSLALVDRLRPARAYFTHIAHDLAHAETNARLPAHVQLAYDGLSIEVNY
jgi:phosphoribosyl 1,2-cyclic phosphate phosphodiesterase